jgi:hypothetical protein
VAEQLVASQEGLSSTELLSYDTGRGCITHERDKKFVQHFDRKSGREEKDHPEDRAAAGKIILQRVLKKQRRGVDWIHSTRDRHQQSAPVSTLM